MHVHCTDLLFSVFRGIDGRIIQIPHSVLNTKVICNLRRSGAISETFTFEIDFGTTFEKIEALREKMLDFLERERRDFHPAFDVVVDDIAGQGKMTLCVVRARSVCLHTYDLQLVQERRHHVQVQLAEQRTESSKEKQVDLRTQDRSCIA